MNTKEFKKPDSSDTDSFKFKETAASHSTMPYSMDLTLKDNPIKYTASGQMIAPEIEEEMEKVGDLGGLAEMM